tara:strand:- start:3 stop:290 length:288 start_codon:yes stop_codon:yes gene_type:complete
LITRVQPKEKARVIKKCLENIKEKDSKGFRQRNKSRDFDSYCARVYDKYALKINSSFNDCNEIEKHLYYVSNGKLKTLETNKMSSRSYFVGNFRK